MALPKETLYRIEKDADAAASKVNDTYRERETQFANRISFLAGYKECYIAGATAENERAHKLVEALEAIANSPVPANDREMASWIETARSLADNGLQQWKGKEADKFEGSVITEPIPGIALGCISPEARELLDTIMEKWEEHYRTVKTDKYEPTFYAFAYWLVRWSGLVRPMPKEEPKPEGWPFVCHICGEQNCESDHK